MTLSTSTRHDNIVNNNLSESAVIIVNDISCHSIRAMLFLIRPYLPCNHSVYIIMLVAIVYKLFSLPFIIIFYYDI